MRVCEYASRAAVGCGLLAQIWVILFASVGSTTMQQHTRVYVHIRGAPIVGERSRPLFHGHERYGRDPWQNVGESRRSASLRFPNLILILQILRKLERGQIGSLRFCIKIRHNLPRLWINRHGSIGILRVLSRLRALNHFYDEIERGINARNFREELYLCMIPEFSSDIRLKIYLTLNVYCA